MKSMGLNLRDAYLKSMHLNFNYVNMGEFDL
jgi:hypothetical protein